MGFTHTPTCFVIQQKVALTLHSNICPTHKIWAIHNTQRIKHTRNAYNNNQLIHRINITEEEFRLAWVEVRNVLSLDRKHLTELVEKNVFRSSPRRLVSHLLGGDTLENWNKIKFWQ